MRALEPWLTAAYLVAIVAAGPLARRLVAGADDFFLAGREASLVRGLGTLLVIFVGGGAVGLAGLGYAMGLAGAWYYLGYALGFAILAATFVLPLRQLSRITLGDILGHRFGPGTARLASAVSLAAWIFLLASLLAAAGRVLQSIFGLAEWEAIALGAAVTLLSAGLGGMRAVVALSWAQALLLLGGLVVLFAAVLLRAGGWSAALAALPPGFGSLAPPERLPVIAGLLLVIAPTTVVGPDVYLNVWSLSSGRTARRALWVLVAVLAAAAIMLAFIGAAARSILPATPPELALPEVAAVLLPPGLAAAVLVGLLGAAVSGAVPETVVCASILTHDIYRGWLAPGASARGLLLVSRASVLAVVLAALALALAVNGVVELALHAYRIFVPAIVPQVICAFYVRRAAPRAVLASMLVGPAVSVAQTLLLPGSLLTYLDPVGPATLAAVAVLALGSLRAPGGVRSVPLFQEAREGVVAAEAEL